MRVTLPASRPPVAIALLLVLIVVLGAGLGEPSQAAHSPAHSSALRSALQWLSANQSSTGSYGSYFEHWTAAAAYALWLNDSQSPKAVLSYSWLAEQLDSSSSWFWSEYGEADVPGAVLRSVAASHHVGMVEISDVSSKLLKFQEPNGGFRGYYDSALERGVTSSVDTAMALWGLADAGAIDSSRKQLAIDYLFSLQNIDGSFNLTERRGSDPLYSQAPEPVSLTAISVLALGAGSITTTDAQLTKGLDFLRTAVTENFTAQDDGGGHVYSASLTAIALDAFARRAEASVAISFMTSSQNSDGGFGDSIRLSGSSNALDTGWAAIALQLVQPSGPAPNSIVLALMGASVLLPAGIILGVIVYLRRRKKKVLTPA